MRRHMVLLIIIILITFLTTLAIFKQFSHNNFDKEISMYSTWTIFVYLSGDNDLEDMVSKNRGLLKSIGSTDDVNIIALTDEKGENNTKLSYIELRSTNETSLKELDPGYADELNMGDNVTLENFAIWSMDNYPADRYVLILWGHGEGWKGVAQDRGDYLTMQELDTALGRIVDHNDGKKLDIIGFDACGMGMLEVFYQVKDYADIAIASEKDIPEHGWPYYHFLKPLTEDPGMSPEDLSRLIVDEYTDSYSSGLVEDEGISVGLTAVDLSKIDDIIKYLEFASTNRYDLVFYEEPDYCDLLQYAQVNELGELEKAINASIIAERHWSNPEAPLVCAYGMTIYYPWDYDSDYDKLKFAQDTNWDEGLKA
jgi:hypothetical protein